jgi:hypothetical protein
MQGDDDDHKKKTSPGDPTAAAKDDSYDEEGVDEEKRPTVVPKYDVETFARNVSRKRSPFPTITDDEVLEAARRASMKTAPPPPGAPSPEASAPSSPSGDDEPMKILGSLEAVPRHAMAPDELTKLGLDHHAGFMLALIDGVLNFDTIIDVCGMPRPEALRVLAQLMKRGIIAVQPTRRSR